MKPEEVKRYIQNPNSYFDAEEYFRIIGYFENELEIDQVFDVLAKGIKAYPDNIELRLEEVRFFIIAGKFSDAEETLRQLNADKSIKDKSDKLAIYVMSTRLNAELGHLYEIEKDLKSYKKMVKGIDQEEAVSATTLIASSYIQCYLVAQAIELLQQAATIFPNDLEILEALIDCHLKDSGDYGLAIKVCEKAIDIDSYNTQFWHKLGYLHYYNNNLQEAIKAFDYATSIKDDMYEDWNAMGDCYIDLENYNKAADCLIKGTNYKTADIEKLTKIGNILNYAGRRDEARNHFKMALNIDPDYAPALYGYGMSIFMTPSPNEESIQASLFWIKRATTEDESNSLYWNTLGDCYFAMSCWTHCIEAYHRSLMLNNEQFDILSRLGYAFLALRDYKEAIKYCLRAKEGRTDTHLVNLYLAMAYYASDNEANTIYYLMQSLESDPETENLFLAYAPEATELVSKVKKLL